MPLTVPFWRGEFTLRALKHCMQKPQTLKQPSQEHRTQKRQRLKRWTLKQQRAGEHLLNDGHQTLHTFQANLHTPMILP